MPALMHKGKNYSGGGTSVTANPTGTATADLTKVGIGSTIYNVKDASAAHLVDGKVPASELPAYVDDVLEYASLSNFPAEGESGKIYIALDTNKTYRWSGSAYVEISQSLALGTTHQTAAYGDDAVSTAEPTFSEASTRTNLAGSGEKLSVILGKIKKWFSDLKAVAFSGSYTDLTNTPTIPTVNNNKITIQLNGTTVEEFTLNQSSDETINIQVTKNDVGLGNVGNFKAVSTVASQGLTETEKANARANIGAGTGSGTVTGVKGNSESSYRTGNVNLTATNIGLGNVGNFKAVSTVANQGLTDTEKSNARANIGAGTSSFSGNYNDLSNKPTIPAAQVNSDWNASSGVAQILNKPTIPAAQIQSDWSQTNTSAVDYIKNKPTIPSASVSGVKGNAESTYRTGNVNLTPANIGALPLSGGTMTGDILGNSTAQIGRANAKYPYGYFDHLNFNTLDMPSGSKIYFEESGTGAHNARPTTVLGNDDNLPTGSAVISYLNNNIGTFYTATWKASSSSAYGADLTNSLTLPKGRYIIDVQSPQVSSNSAIAGVACSSGTITKPVNDVWFYLGLYNHLSTTITVTSDSATVLLRTGFSASVTYSYTERGYIRAIKVG